LVGAGYSVKVYSCKPCPKGQKKKWTINKKGKSVAKCVKKEKCGKKGEKCQKGKPVLCHTHGVYQRPNYTSITVIEYESWSYEEYQSIAEQYTYWISHCQSKSEYQKWVKEFEYITEHYSQYHSDYDLFAIPHITEWDVTVEVTHEHGHSHGHEAHPEPQVVDTGIVCFSKGNAEVQKLIDHGAKYETVEEADYEVHVNDWIYKIEHSSSFEEYTSYVQKYEEYYHHYEVEHKGCGYCKHPKPKSFGGHQLPGANGAGRPPKDLIH
jgi:hypothetical protein